MFYDDLQDVLNGVPHEDLLLLLGDFNAHVGVRDRASDLWSGVLGCFGIEHRNQAAIDFCDFITQVINTCFQKWPNYSGTWTRPATKHWSLIDFVMMKSAQC